MRNRLLPAVFLLLAACNDLTEPTQSIAGEYQYDVVDSFNGSNTRNGKITIFDDDRRTARFTGTFNYRDGQGRVVQGHLQGAFTSADSVWFQFLDERFVYHEGFFARGTGGGRLFVQGVSYEPTGLTFELIRLRGPQLARFQQEVPPVRVR